MLNPLISLVLATALLACPYLCGGSLVSADVGAQSAPSCCCHSQQLPRDSAPAEEGPRDSTSCCQCVCGGAVLEHAPLVQVDMSVWSAAAVELQPSVALALASRPLLEPDGGMNPGRAKRCLFMTLLC
jgi:hypothetical protein